MVVAVLVVFVLALEMVVLVAVAAAVVVVVVEVEVVLADTDQRLTHGSCQKQGTLGCLLQGPPKRRP